MRTRELETLPSENTTKSLANCIKCLQAHSELSTRLYCLSLFVEVIETRGDSLLQNCLPRGQSEVIIALWGVFEKLP